MLQTTKVVTVVTWLALPLCLAACGPKPEQVAAQCQMKTLQSFPNRMFLNGPDFTRTQNDKVAFAYACMKAAGFEPRDLHDPSCWVGPGVNIRPECFKRM
jgi:hypothetical protein